MLEPQPVPAKKLRELYSGNPGILVVEAALDSKSGKRSLFMIDELQGLPGWVGGMASFRREHLEKHNYAVPEISSLIVEREVECVTIDDVLENFPDGKVDILQIDAEGYDEKILSMFPFERVTPEIVHWESKNLTRKEQELALARLIAFGYRVARSGAEDSMAVRQG